MSYEEFMHMAIAKAREGVEQGELPFGACIVKDGIVLGCEHNTILSGEDVTAHAEMNAIKHACRALNSLDLSGCVIYCTCEPCPMCLGALGLANVSRIVYGARISDVDLAGYTVLETPEGLAETIGNGRIQVTRDFLKDEAIKLFREWERRHGL